MKKSYTAMTSRELAAATREFDREREPKFLKPPDSEKRRHDAAVRTIKRRRGRPRVGGGARRVQITVEHSLLQMTDRFARSKGLTRSELIARCLMSVVSKRSA